MKYMLLCMYAHMYIQACVCAFTLQIKHSENSDKRKRRILNHPKPSSQK